MNMTTLAEAPASSHQKDHQRHPLSGWHPNSCQLYRYYWCVLIQLFQSTVLQWYDAGFVPARHYNFQSDVNTEHSFLLKIILWLFGSYHSIQRILIVKSFIPFPNDRANPNIFALHCL